MRMLVDCTLIDFSRQPTGIPRVVMKYLQEGYRWGRKNDCEIVPVLPTKDGIYVVRPLPNWLTREHREELKPYLAEAGDGEPFARRRKSRVVGPRISPGSDDILFCPAYWHDVDPAIYFAARRDGAFVCTLVHDLLPILFENCYNAPWRFQFRDNAIAAIEYSNAIFTVSSYTRMAVTELAIRNHKTVPACEVAYNGFEPLTTLDVGSTRSYLGDRRLARLLDERPAALLMVGSIEPKKAHLPVMQALEQMWDGGYERDLIIVGRRGWLEQPIVDYMRASSYFGRKLFWFDGLDDADLALCYSRCHALVFASLGEGFGIPMIEASYYHKPVVVYDTEIAREILDDQGLFFSNARGFVDWLVALDDPQGYAAIASSRRAFSWPTWAELAPATFDKMLRLRNSATPR